jgi:hypothetical protein
MRIDVRGVAALAMTVALTGACAAEGAEGLGEEDLPSGDLMGAQIETGDGTTAQAEPDPAFRSADEPEDVPGQPLPTVCPPGRWCSALYPPTWTPDAKDAEGRFFHDFSYAGYRNGQTPPAQPKGATYDVTTYGASAAGASDATGAIQAAVNAASAAGGGIVFFPAGNYRLEGTVNVTASGVVLRGVGNASVLQFNGGRGIVFSGQIATGAQLALAADGESRSTEVLVTDASSLAPGDDVSVGWKITPEFVAEHAMTGTWKVFNGQHAQMFRRQVVSVDTTSVPHRVVLDVPLRYTAKVRDGAAIQKESGYLREVGLESVAITNATTWSRAWADNSIHAVGLKQVADGWVRDVHSVATPGATGQNASDTRAYHLRSSGIIVTQSKRVSILGSSMENAQNRGSGGNGYLFELSRTSEVLIADSVARNGRHNFIQNWGFGNSGTVFLRCVSSGSELLSLIGGKLTPEKAYSEHHHSLAMATLVDDSRLDDGFKFENRGAWSSGAGHTATESVVWRPSGKGDVISKQHGWGYVIGADATMTVDTNVSSAGGEGTGQEDFVEGKGQGDTLYPASLYENQRARRLQP